MRAASYSLRSFSSRSARSSTSGAPLSIGTRTINGTTGAASDPNQVGARKTSARRRARTHASAPAAGSASATNNNPGRTRTPEHNYFPPGGRGPSASKTSGGEHRPNPNQTRRSQQARRTDPDRMQS